MTGQYHPDLHRLADVATVDSPRSFTLLGYQVEPGEEQLLRVLESELYLRLYSGSAEPRSPHTEDPAESLAFIGALSQANTGVGTWEPGWRILAVPEDPAAVQDGVSTVPEGSALSVVRDGVTFRVERSQVRTASASLSPGGPCSVCIGKEMRHLLFGFYLAQGDIHPGDGTPLVRLYWHLTPDAAVHYLHEATDRLNRAGIPFQTKVVSNPRHYLRRDSGVLYLRKADFDRAAPLLTEIYETVGAGLLPDVPLFTKPLAPGLALAEDPKGGMSFGQSRCHIAAQGLWQCYLHGLTAPDQRLNGIAEAFRAEGIDPACPYLEAGSVDCYGWGE